MSCHAIGALNLKWFSSSCWPRRDNPLIVSCSIARELSDPCGSFETLTHSRHTSSNGFSLGQLHWNTSVKLVAPESRPNLSRSLAQAHAPFFVLSFMHYHLGSPGSVCRKHRVKHLLSTDLWRFCDDLCRNLCCSLVLRAGKDLQHHRGRVALLF